MPDKSPKIDPDYLRKQFEDEGDDLYIKYNRIKRDAITNPTDEGSYLEQILIDFFCTYLPKKYGINRGYIMNDKGHISLQQDIVIYNQDKYVLLKNTDNFAVFPVESVYATIEVKSKLSKQILTECIENIKSIKSLSGTQLLCEVPSGRVEKIEPYGGRPCCIVFAFESDANIVTRADNLRELNGGVDLIVILTQGIISYYTGFTPSVNEHAVFTITTTPNFEKDRIAILREDQMNIKGLALSMLLQQIIDHVRIVDESGIKYWMLDYFKIPGNAYRITYYEDPDTDSG